MYLTLAILAICIGVIAWILLLPLSPVIWGYYLIFKKRIMGTNIKDHGTNRENELDNDLEPETSTKVEIKQDSTCGKNMERWKILGLKAAGWSNERIAEEMGTTKAMITSFLCMENEKDKKESVASQEAREMACEIRNSTLPIKTQQKLIDMLESNRWIPIDEKQPESNRYVLVSFENISNPPDIARYEEDKYGGAFYPKAEEESYAAFGIIVNAWRPLPAQYTEDA